MSDIRTLNISERNYISLEIYKILVQSGKSPECGSTVQTAVDQAEKMISSNADINAAYLKKAMKQGR